MHGDSDAPQQPPGVLSAACCWLAGGAQQRRHLSPARTCEQRDVAVSSHRHDLGGKPAVVPAPLELDLVQTGEERSVRSTAPGTRQPAQSRPAWHSQRSPFVSRIRHLAWPTLCPPDRRWPARCASFIQNVSPGTRAALGEASLLMPRLWRRGPPGAAGDAGCGRTRSTTAASCLRGVLHRMCVGEHPALASWGRSRERGPAGAAASITRCCARQHTAAAHNSEQRRHTLCHRRRRRR